MMSKGRSEDVEKLYVKVMQLEQEKKELQARIDFLENKYEKKKKK